MCKYGEGVYEQFNDNIVNSNKYNSGNRIKVKTFFIGNIVLIYEIKQMVLHKINRISKCCMV